MGVYKYHLIGAYLMGVYRRIPSLATTVHFSALAFLRGTSLKQGPNHTKKIRRVPPVSAYKLGQGLGEGPRGNAKALKCTVVASEGYLIGVYLTGVYVMGVHLMGVHLMGVHLIGLYLTGLCLTGVHLIGVYLINVHLIGVYFIDVHLTSVYLLGVHLIGVHLIGVYLMGVHLTGVHLIGVHLRRVLYGRVYVKFDFPNPKRF